MLLSSACFTTSSHLLNVMTFSRKFLAGFLLWAAVPVVQECPAQYDVPLDGVPVARPVQASTFSAPAASDPNRVLGVGDQISLLIVEDRAPAVARIITDTGDVEVPWIGRVPAAGKTTSQLAQEIERKLESSYYYDATVKLAIDRVNPRAAVETIYVSGEVRGSGPQRFAKGETVTVSAAILRAGGFGQFANERKVQVTRKQGNGDGVRLTVDVKAILQEGKTSEDIELRDGDYIFVPRNFINF
jgi:polysaccharide export outer membrane protein